MRQLGRSTHPNERNLFNSAHRRRLRPLYSQRGRAPATTTAAAAPGHAPGNDTDEEEEKGASEAEKIYSLICCGGGGGGGQMMAIINFVISRSSLRLRTLRQIILPMQ